MEIRKPVKVDLIGIEGILRQWTEEEEVEKYLDRIEKEISGVVKYGMRFWVIEMKGEVAGVGGLADPLPKVQEFIKNQKAIEIKILYLDNKFRGKGLGKVLLDFLEDQAKGDGIEEIIVRTAKRYEKTAWGFYEGQRYLKVGTVDDEMAVYRKIIGRTAV